MQPYSVRLSGTKRRRSRWTGHACFSSPTNACRRGLPTAVGACILAACASVAWVHWYVSAPGEVAGDHGRAQRHHVSSHARRGTRIVDAGRADRHGAWQARAIEGFPADTDGPAGGRSARRYRRDTGAEELSIADGVFEAAATSRLDRASRVSADLTADNSNSGAASARRSQGGPQAHREGISASHVTSADHDGDVGGRPLRAARTSRDAPPAARENSLGGGYDTVQQQRRKGSGESDEAAGDAVGVSARPRSHPEDVARSHISGAGNMGDAGARGAGNWGQHREDVAVPDWAKPTGEELQSLVRTQFGMWRNMADAVPRRVYNNTSPYQPSSSQGATWTALAARPAAGGASLLPDMRSRCQRLHQGASPFPERDLEPCYDEMREKYVFGPPLKQVEVLTMGEGKPVKQSPRGVVTFMSTSQTKDVHQLKRALAALTNNFLARHAYPVAIIHEDFTADLMESLQVLVPVPIHFVKVEFKLPDWMEPLSWIYPLAVKHFTGHPQSQPLVGYHSDMHGLLPHVKRGGFGYFHMCRFFGGAGFMLPFFDEFDFYFRLDSDSICDRPLPDLFARLADADADYAYDTTFLDHGDVTEGLWNFAEQYMLERDIPPTFWNSPEAEGRPFEALAMAKKRETNPLCKRKPSREQDVVAAGGARVHALACRDGHFQALPAFYTNFEVARIEMFRSSWYQNWFNAVDKTGSIYYNRWGDAPIRFIGLAMHLPAEKILRVDGCRHP